MLTILFNIYKWIGKMVITTYAYIRSFFCAVQEGETTMKAIRVHEFGGPEVLKLEDVPEPAPGPGQVLVRIDAIGVNPVETYIRSGKYGPKQFPYTPGTDAGGVIEEVGEGDCHRPGRSCLRARQPDRNLCPEGAVQRVPRACIPLNTTFQQGAAIGVPYATAYRAMYLRGRALAGETVLVHGASGGVGIAAVQLARAAGLTVFGTAGTPRGLDLVAAEGAHYVLNHHDPNYLKELMDLTGGHGVDLILEMAAHTNLGKDLPLLAKNGRVVVIGSRGPVEITPRKPWARRRYPRHDAYERHRIRAPRHPRRDHRRPGKPFAASGDRQRVPPR